ncbi:MAG: DUF6635 family protein, partial [Vicinamibacterales bacterium]
AVAFVTLRRICQGLDHLGVTQAAVVLRRVPARIRTGYQRRIEDAIAQELLEWGPVDAGALPEGLLRELSRDADVWRATRLGGSRAGRPLAALLDGFSAARALVSDLAGGALTLAAGWFAFGSTSLGVFGLADRMARASARSRAAGRFFLGSRAGSVFYGVFPPDASPLETLLMLALVGLALALGTLVCALLIEPLRRWLGLHHRRLGVLVDSLERELTVIAHTQVLPTAARTRRATEM